ncbi:PrpF protein [Ectobacillus funiculus]|uniref:PrpF domain-containing protein n=1 Tax=Ectobacillus funiculus TaxID=137993 RepID=UPI00397ADD29
MAQSSIPCSIYRGGTSRGLFFNKLHLPEDEVLQKKIFMSGIDSYNPSQIDGLGSGTSHSSKVCVISQSNLEGIDVEYTFIQVGISEEIIDSKGTCGNLMAAVGAFAVDEGMVGAKPTDREVLINVFNTNIQKVLQLTIPLENGKAKATGNYHMPGLVKPGAKFTINILSPGGGTTGSTLPLGMKTRIKVKNTPFEVSFVDIVNPFVIISAESLGIKGTELNKELAPNEELLDLLDSIRCEMAVMSGIAKDVNQAKYEMPSVPKIAIVTEPQDYCTSSGSIIKKDNIDIIAKMVSMGKFHRTFAGSGLYNLAATTLLPGTIANQLATKKDSTQNQVIRIGHPEGVAKVNVSLNDKGNDVAFVSLDRTARRIMKGELYYPLQDYSLAD